MRKFKIPEALVKELANTSTYVNGVDVEYRFRKQTIPVIEFNEAVAIIEKHWPKKEKEKQNGKNRLVKRKNIRS